jgi:hypothetical protein
VAGADTSIPTDGELHRLRQRLERVENANAVLWDLVKQLRLDQEALLARLKAIERTVPLKRPKSPPKSR